MSTPPNKRLHEESGKDSHDDLAAHSSGGSKLMPSVSNEYHARHDVGQDNCMPKIEYSGRRLPLAPTSRGSSSFTDLGSGHRSAGSESRLDFKDSRESKRDLKLETRDAQTESKDSYIGAKVDKDVKFEIRGDVNKETKHEKVPYAEFKNTMNPDKDAYDGASRDKRYLDTPGRDVAPSHGYRTIVHGPAEIGKESYEDKDYLDSREAVEDNKIDLKGEDKFKDKDKGKKEGKQREQAERDKERNDCVNNMKVCVSSSVKDLMKGEGDAERSGTERKDLSKDKGRLEVRVKECMKKEAASGAEKESLPNEKETSDVSRRAVDHESWKNVDKDGRDRKEERDGEEGQRPDKRSRYREESDEGVDAEGGTEREREAFSGGVQQRKRMPRPRSSPHANRDPRFRSRSLDNEGSQDKPDVSTVVYKNGECMLELTKLWEEYESSEATGGSGGSGSPQKGPSLEFRIPAEHVCASNPKVRGAQLWGTDVYTNDSDLVAVLMHTGYFRATAYPPLSTIQELRATIRMLPPQNCYLSTLRNNVRSRAWGAATGCSYCVERCCIVKKGGGTVDLVPVLTPSSTLEFTLAPVAVERTMTTRAAASNAQRQKRSVREVAIQFNLCQEPWLKYSISVVADKGLEKPLFTSSRLKKGEVLYLETHSRRYELCFERSKAAPATQEHEMENDKFHSTTGENMEIDVFRWSCCKKPLLQERMLAIGTPLPLEHVEVLEDNLEWDDIEWSPTGVMIAGRVYRLARAIFLSQN